MNDIFGWQVESGSNFGVSCITTVEGDTIFQQFRPSRPVNGTIYTTTPQQGLVGRIDNGINFEFCDVSHDDFDLPHVCKISNTWPSTPI